MPKLKKKYIDTNKIKYQYVNLAFLGKDSIVGSRAQHAVNHYAPKKSLEFQKLMFNQQKDEHKQWITTRLVDKQIDKLSISDDKKKKIKTDYKTKGSISWKKPRKINKLRRKITSSKHLQRLLMITRLKIHMTFLATRCC